jgi:NAD(P)-dependent dehydrogenase (short-subunit alcohol dehydrogenase family)
MDQLEGKVAVVTGGGSGIGQGIVEACAQAGMRIVVSDIELDAAERVAEAARETGVDAFAVQTDVADRSSTDALAERVYESFGEANLLCNNAGVIIETPIVESTDADWEWLFQVNVMGVVHGIQSFVPHMREQMGAAHIVNTASNAGIVIPPVPVATYAATKHAVVAISDRLRHEIADDGIGVSVLCPGGVASRLFEADRNLPVGLIGKITPSRRREGRASPDRMLPAAVGERVLWAVREQRFFVITHPKELNRVDARYEELRADYEAAMNEYE